MSNDLQQSITDYLVDTFDISDSAAQAHAERILHEVHQHLVYAVYDLPKEEAP